MTGFARALTEALAAQLAGIAGIAVVYPEWPEANVQLALPSISIVTQQAQYVRSSPYLIGIGTVVNAQATTTYCVGTYDVNMQLDVWAKYKIQRADLLDAVMNFLQPVNPEGFMLQLAAYFNEWASVCVMGGPQWLDTEDSATRKEWRGKINLQATCRAVNTVNEHIITQPPVLQFDTPDNIT